MEEQVPAQLQHIVKRARLGVIVVVGLRVERSGNHVALAQDLADAHAAMAVSPMRHDHVPEVLRRGVVLAFVVLLVDAQVAGELRDVLVGVATVEDVVPGYGRVLHVTIVEVARDGEVLRLVAPERVQAGERVVGSAVFARDVHVPHPIELLGAELGETAVRPVADLRRDVERLRVPGERVRGDETGEDLV